jgi:type I restriction enzyme S subunit
MMKDEFNIPKVALGEVCDFVRGVTFDGNDAIDVSKEGYVPILRAGNIGDELYIQDDLVWVPEKRVSKEQYFQVGDIAICMASGSPAVLGKTAQLKENFMGSVGAFCGIIRPIKADPNYIAYWLKSPTFMAWRDSQANGVNIQNLRPNEVREIEIPLPPLTEQKRIASLLARADRLRQLRRTAHELGDALLQSVFLEMFGDVAHSKWDKSELGELIEGFEAGVNYLPGGEGEKVSEWRVLKISAVTWGDFDPTESKAIREYDEFDEKHIVRQGDLLISRANTTELVGAVSLVKIIPPKVLLPDKLWRVKFKEDSAILPEYTLHLLRQPELRKIIGDLATGSSGSMKNISMEKAYTLPIPVPPLSLQEEFAGVVARVESLRGRMGESTRQVEGLFESLLEQSFSSY